jgi:Uma2 family endonuclease
MDTMLGTYTRDHYLLLPEGFPAQLIEGCLVREPAPGFGHQRIAGDVFDRLRRLVGSRRAAMAPVDIVIDEFNVFQPDIVVFRTPMSDDMAAEDLAVPLLVVEVLSPSTAGRDRSVKRTRLLDAGVEEVWLIDRDQHMIEVYDRGRYRDIPRRATGAEGLASAVLPGFDLTPRALFA